MPRILIVLLIAVTAMFADVLNAQNGAGAGRGAPSARNSIVGRVVDPTGHPVADVFVTALQARPHGDRPWSFVSAKLRSVTGPDGEYRLDGLPFDPLYILAIPHNAVRAADGQLNRHGLGQTFFPNAGTVDAAKTISATPTGPARADITLTTGALHTISGVVMTESGAPAANVVVELSHGDGLFGLDSRGFRTSAAGTFGMGAVLPGTYFLLFDETALPRTRGVIPLVSRAKVVVGTSDVVGVRVAPLHMVAVSGRIVVDPSIKPFPDPATLEIGASPLDFDGNPGPQQPGVPGRDFSFSFKTWPSRGLIRMFPEDRWVVKAIRIRGSVVPNAIDFVEGADQSGIEVDIAARQPGRGAPFGPRSAGPIIPRIR